MTPVRELARVLDPRVARRAAGLLGDFAAAGVLAAADVHAATALGRLGGETDAAVLLAAALCVRGARQGSVVLDLDEVAVSVGAGEEDDVEPPAGQLGAPPPAPAALPWPEPAAWARALWRSPIVGGPSPEVRDRPLRVSGHRVWLDRYWRQEEQLAADLLAAAARPVQGLDLPRLAAALRRLWPGQLADDQRLAAAVAALTRVAVVAGGPGTGKTTTVARLLAVLHDQPGPPPRIALAAPTGKAAARLTEAVAVATAGLGEEDRDRMPAVAATTLHRLLGWRPDARSRFRHDREHRLSADVVVVDESSMVSLTLMARLVEALRSDARLVLLGDPDQLASVEAGAVLGDLTAALLGSGERTAPMRAALQSVVPHDVDLASGPPGAPATAAPVRPAAILRDGFVVLRRVHRFEEGGAIAALAAAVREGDADEALRLLEASGADVRWLPVADSEPVTGVALAALRAAAVAPGAALARAAVDGRAEDALDALDSHRVLCAHRLGPRGVRRWSEQIARWLTEEGATSGPRRADGHSVGDPLLVTSNDPDTGLFNGDTGVVVRDVPGRWGPAGAAVAVFRRGADPFAVQLPRLGDARTLHAMTVHKAQGSQLDRVSVILPPASSPLGTRETLYTAITRARTSVLLVGSPAAVRACVRRPVARATGLRERLR